VLIVALTFVNTYLELATYYLIRFILIFFCHQLKVVIFVANVFHADWLQISTLRLRQGTTLQRSQCWKACCQKSWRIYWQLERS